MIRRVLFLMGCAAFVAMAQEDFSDAQIAEKVITEVGPAHIERPSVRYAPSRDVRMGDSVQVIVRFKPNGGTWTIPWQRKYSPNIAPLDWNELLLVVRAAIVETPKATP